MVDITKERAVKRLLDTAGAALSGLSELGVRPEEVWRVLEKRKQEAGIPVSIFNTRLGALESIVKYMREELALDYCSIARMLSRGEGPIGVTYRRAKRKHAGRLDVSADDVVPFSVLCGGRLSVLEGISYHLAKQGHDWHDIARIMCRHDKTIWTVLDRAKRKMRAKR